MGDGPAGTADEMSCMVSSSLVCVLEARSSQMYGVRLVSASENHSGLILFLANYSIFFTT